jgi:hypothetical protein
MKLKSLNDYQVEPAKIVCNGVYCFTVYQWQTLPHALAIVRIPCKQWEALNYEDKLPYPMEIIDHDFNSMELIVVRADHPLALLAIAWYRKCRFFERGDAWLLWQANRLGLAETPRDSYVRWQDLKLFRCLR